MYRQHFGSSPIRSVFVIGAAFIIYLLAQGIPTFAHSNYPPLVPNGSVFSCDMCHGSNSAFHDAFASHNNQWSAALAALDSDGDGYTNGQELLDPTGAWQPGDPNPGNPADVTNPGDQSSHPSGNTATPTATRTPTAAVTNSPSPTRTSTSVVTNTPTPTGANSSTPSPTRTSTTAITNTATPIPTSTRTAGATVTATPPPSPTATRTQPPSTPTEAATATPQAGEFQVDIFTNQDTFAAGDSFLLSLTTQNDDQVRRLDRYVILDVVGSYWFYPRWTTDVDSEAATYNAQQSDTLSILSFEWPQGTGAGGAVFWAAYLEADTFNLVGAIDSVEFSFD